MTRIEVENILKEKGYTTKDELDENRTKGKYTVWYHSKSKEPAIWLGDYFIEIWHQPLAFPYKDERSTHEKLRWYIDGENKKLYAK